MRTGRMSQCFDSMERDGSYRAFLNDRRQRRSTSEGVASDELPNLIPVIATVRRLLSDEDFLLVDFVVLRGLTFAQVARELGAHRSTIRGRFRRVINRLRTHPMMVALATQSTRAIAA